MLLVIKHIHLVSSVTPEPLVEGEGRYQSDLKGKLISPTDTERKHKFCACISNCNMTKSTRIAE